MNSFLHQNFHTSHISSNDLPTAGCVEIFADALFKKCHDLATDQSPNDKLAYQIAITDSLNEIVEGFDGRNMTYVQSMMFDAIIHMRDREAKILKSLMQSETSGTDITPLTQTLYIPMSDRVKLTCRDVSYAGIRLGLW